MKASSAAINGALAVAGLVAAYATWQRPRDTGSNDNVVVLEASRATLNKVRFDDGSRVLELTRPDGAKTVWLRQETLASPLTRMPSQYTLLPDGGPALPTDGGALDAGGIVVEVKQLPPEPPPPPRITRGNERAETLLGRFTPFEAVRALGTLSKEKEKELGLEGSVRTLAVTVSGQVHTYAVSNPQPGMIGTYLKDKDGAVYLLTGSLLSELEPSSQALVDRRLHTFRAPEYDEFVIGYDTVKRAYLQKDAEIPQTMKVSAKETPDKPDDLVRNWHDKVWNRLIVTEVLGKDEAPKTGAPKVELRIDYLARGANKGFLELGKGPGGELWARTENTASWVGLHSGTDDLIAEAKKFTTTSRP